MLLNRTAFLVLSVVAVVALLSVGACTSAPTAPAAPSPTTAAAPTAAQSAVPTAQPATPPPQPSTPAAQPAADFPKQPLRIIVQYPAGGGVDITARLLAKHAEKYLGQSVVVENRVGGAGVLGVSAAASANPDGYTMVFIFGSTAAEKYLLENVTYSIDSFDPVVQVTFEPAMVVAKAGGPFDKPLPEVVQQSKDSPVTMGIGAVWTGFDFLRLLLEKQTGAKFTRVGFQGGGPVTKAILAGDVNLGLQFPSEWLNYYKNGELKGLASASEKPWAGFEKVPTFREMGINIGDLGVRRVLVAPKGVPEERLAFLEKAFMQALVDPALVEDFAKAGMGVLPASRKDALQLLNAEAEIVVNTVKELGLKPGDVPK